MTSLYELNSNFQEVQTMIEDGKDGLQDTLESIDLAINDKLENIGKIIRNLESESQAHKDEEQRLAKKRKTLENNIKHLKQYAENSMIVTGDKKVKAGLFTFSIQKNPPSVNVYNDELVPRRFYKEVDPKLDKAEIKELLKNGESIPGVELQQSEGLRFK